MTRPRLAIIVPTFNRSASLRLLLHTLQRELEGLAGRVTVLVGDNASADDTPEVTAAFAAAMPLARVVRHAENLGPDENFCRCVEASDADWFWIIGDDDLPRAGAVRMVLDLLERHTPDLVYLESEWRQELVDNDPAHPLPAVAPLVLDRLAFARRVNVWTTFISGLVVRRAPFVDGAGAAGLRCFAKTNLVQLAWVLGTLERGRRLMVVPAACVLATAGNTGGYAVLKVFGENFAAIVGECFGADSPIARAMVRRCVIGYLPALLWALRAGQVGSFEQEDPSAALRPQLGRYAAFRLLVTISRGPRAAALCALFACKVAARLLKAADRVRERLWGRTTLA